MEPVQHAKLYVGIDGIGISVFLNLVVRTYINVKANISLLRLACVFEAVIHSYFVLFCWRFKEREYTTWLWIFVKGSNLDICIWYKSMANTARLCMYAWPCCDPVASAHAFRICDEASGWYDLVHDCTFKPIYSTLLRVLCTEYLLYFQISIRAKYSEPKIYGQSPHKCSEFRLTSYFLKIYWQRFPLG